MTTAVDVDAARAAVLNQRTVLEQWEATKADAQRDLERLQTTSGETLLEDPSKAGALGEDIARLSTQVILAERAIDAVRPRIAAAESAYLHAEADILDRVAEVEKAKAAAHHAKVRSLLDQLEELDGVEYLRGKPKGVPVAGQPGATAYKNPVSVQVEHAADAARRQAASVRALASGQDPRGPLGDTESLPGCLSGPTALVPAPEFLAAVERARRAVRDLEHLQSTLGETVEAEIEQARRAATPQAAIDSKRERLAARLAELPDEIANAQAHLRDLTGVAS